MKKKKPKGIRSRPPPYRGRGLIIPTKADALFELTEVKYPTDIWYENNLISKHVLLSWPVNEIIRAVARKKLYYDRPVERY